MTNPFLLSIIWNLEPIIVSSSQKYKLFGARENKVFKLDWTLCSLYISWEDGATGPSGGLLKTYSLSSNLSK